MQPETRINWEAVSRLARSVAPSPSAEAVAYRKALWAWWALPETEPLSAFHDALVTLRAAEAACPSATLLTALREAARAWHRATGRCPFCAKAGPLHLPSEAIWETTPR